MRGVIAATLLVRGTKMKLTFDDVRRMALALPGVMERTSYGRPSFYIGKRMLVCLGKQSDHVVAPMSFEERDLRLEGEPDVYFVTDHYRGWPCVLVRLATVREDALRALLERTWREIAPKRRNARA
jgi:hypothetical protein